MDLVKPWNIRVLCWAIKPLAEHDFLLFDPWFVRTAELVQALVVDLVCVRGFVCLFVFKRYLSVIWGFYQTNPHKEFRTSKSAVFSVSRSSTEIIKVQQVKLAADGISAFLAWVCSGSQQQQHNIIQASWVWSVLLTVFKTVFIKSDLAQAWLHKQAHQKWHWLSAVCPWQFTWPCTAALWNHSASFAHLKEKTFWFLPVFHNKHLDIVVVASCIAVGVCLHLYYIFTQLKISMGGCRRVAQVPFSCCNQFVGLCNLFTWSLLSTAYGEGGTMLVIQLVDCWVSIGSCKGSCMVMTGTVWFVRQYTEKTCMCCVHVLHPSIADKP